LGKDVVAITRIYNESVLHSVATFQISPDTVRRRQSWLRSHGARHPAFVLEQAGAIMGWSALSPYSLREAWRFTVEDSIYLDASVLGRGWGEKMLTHLLEVARGLGHRVVLARIVASHKASICLHQKLGFTEAGRLCGVGFKFGVWHDVIYLQKDFGTS
jgi:phosphinothricin acetyltransferase